MTTLVTGATGLVGFHIVQALLRRERSVRVLARSVDKARRLLPEEVEVVQGDVTDPETVAPAVEGCAVVYHAAGLPEQWQPEERVFVETNVEGTRAVMDAAQAAGVERFVYTSTIDVFAAGPGEEYDESVIDPMPKGTPYERSKQEADRIVARAIEDGLPAVFLHPAAVYGPGPDGSPGINDLFRKLRDREAPSLLPGGMPVVFAEDVGEGHVRAEAQEVGARFILADRYATLEEIAERACVALGRNVPMTVPLFVARGISALTEGWASMTGQPPLVPSGQLHFLQWGARPSADRARAELELEFVPLEEGIPRTIEWLRED